jgi:tRNA dimethylallyltransferase
MSQQKIILVGGPTAAGKSSLALELAVRHNGTLINADAMQIYEGLPILSARPSPEEQRQVPHALYGTLDPAEASSAGAWLRLATEAIGAALAAGRTPILVGGTGLYFRALLGGLAEIPPIPGEARAKAQELYDRLGEEKFRAALAKLDPASAARLARNDRQRLIRAYEVVSHTGKTLKEWHNPSGIQRNHQLALDKDVVVQSYSQDRLDSGFRRNDAVFETHMILPPRDELYAACDRRFLLMMERGAVKEAENFLKRGLDPALPVMKTIGVREIGAYLKGEGSLEQAISKSQQATRNYAKRQMTWFRNQEFGAHTVSTPLMGESRGGDI